MHLFIDFDCLSSKSRLFNWKDYGRLVTLIANIVYASPYPLGSVLHADSGPGLVTSCGQRNSSKFDTSTTEKACRREPSHPAKAIPDQPASG